jgi:hypothetical protein
MNMRVILSAFAIAMMLAGCGGTNTTDGANAYNRAPGQNDGSPTSLDRGSASANEILAVSAVINAEEVQDAKQITATVDALKKLSVPPKRVFLLGLNATNAALWRKLLATINVNPVPIIGPKSGDWKKVLKAIGAEKLYGNGPILGGPNVEGVTVDQSSETSVMVFEGIRFFAVNTDTPLKKEPKGNLPRLWLSSRIAQMKEPSAVVIGWRGLRSLGEGDETPVLGEANPELLFGKTNKVQLFVSSAAKAPLLARPDDKSIYQMSVGGAIGDDKLPKVGIIEVRKNKSINARIMNLSATAAPTNLLEAIVWDPSPSKAIAKPVEGKSAEVKPAK